MVEKEKVRKMVEFKAWLEKHIAEVETELEGLRSLLEFTDASLLQKGFKRAEITKSPPTPPEATTSASPGTILPQSGAAYQETIPLKTVTGDTLANMHVEEGSIRIELPKDIDFDVNTPPFTSFLIERVLAKMQKKDRAAAGVGEIASDKILSYSINRDGDIIRELTIRNVRSERLHELKSTIRWTLEKMHEKMMQTSPV